MEVRMPVQTAWLRDGQALGLIIDACGISERELARRALLGHSTINHLLTGRRRSCSVQTAKTIAEILGVDVHTLFVL
jgi:transcriptional regulator with XRE-family HTH domain